MSNAERINCYTCSDGHRIVTVDVDSGVTPFLLGCKTEGCVHMAESAFYRPPDEVGAAQWEWYRPSEREVRQQEEKFPGSLDHWDRGGLSLRAIRPQDAT